METTVAQAMDERQKALAGALMVAQAGDFWLGMASDGHRVGDEARRYHGIGLELLAAAARVRRIFDAPPIA